ncbi:hypothetical protein FSP39_003368 [Pinctada imbricata]|uniref:Lysosomal dipeptide transporter MFSD1 n=1 Tax=Pinctada imbricata TaxID=66713 RepID=A0AA88XNS4_PINIB|nr:hypothetical protein FSP39_003368 [Pinctada imbricata]
MKKEFTLNELYFLRSGVRKIKNTSPVYAGLILTEALAEAMDTKQTLYAGFLDASKAFDVVRHDSMLRKLYIQGLEGTDWLLLKNWYTGMRSKVKWGGGYSSAFLESQGVRQGGIWSPTAYKMFINPALDLYETYHLGFKIGSVHLGSPTCADDELLLHVSTKYICTANNYELWLTYKKHANRERYTLSEAKSKVMVFNKMARTKEDSGYIELNNKELEIVDSYTHIGIERHSKVKAGDKGEAAVMIARKTTYSLMGAGFHGYNGVNPKVSIKMWAMYVKPRMLYGLESHILKRKDIDAINHYHKKIIKQLMHLPQRTADAAVYILAGDIPIEGNLHIKILGQLAGYRFLVLFFNCMLTFGSYFCFDMPSVLQDDFQGKDTCNGTNSNSSSANCTRCEGCLGMSADDYNLLYAIYAWTNAAVVIGAGFLIDKLGNRFGVFLFSFLCVLGSSTFAVGAMFKGTSAMLPVMLLGRLLFGSGNGSLTIVQNRITAYWFKNKELAMAFGITLAFSRLGSVLNFFLTQNFNKMYGLNWTLWGGAMLCGIGFLSAITVSFLDKWGVKQLGDEETLKSESKKLKVTDIKNFSLSYWLLALTIMFFYNSVFPFVADASEFIHQKYDMPKTTSSYIAGAVYDVSMILSPFLGGIIDIIGKRGILALVCALLTIPLFGLLAFTTVYPLICTLWLGVTYSFAAASMWPSIPLVVTQATIGIAMGLTTSIQMIGIGISNVVVGQILGKDFQDLPKDKVLVKWKYVMVFLLANSLACVATTVFLNIKEKQRGGVLNLSRKEKAERDEKLLIDDELPDERTPILRKDDRHSIN